MCWKQPGWANFGSPDGQCLCDWWPSLHPLPWDPLLCSWGGNFTEGRKKRESSKAVLSPSQPVSAQGSPLIRGWVFWRTCTCQHHSRKCKTWQCFWDPSRRAVGWIIWQEFQQEKKTIVLTLLLYPTLKELGCWHFLFRFYKNDTNPEVMIDGFTFVMEWVLYYPFVPWLMIKSKTAHSSESAGEIWLTYISKFKKISLK